MHAQAALQNGDTSMQTWNGKRMETFIFDVPHRNKIIYQIDSFLHL